MRRGSKRDTSRLFNSSSRRDIRRESEADKFLKLCKKMPLPKPGSQESYGLAPRQNNVYVVFIYKYKNICCVTKKHY